MSTLTVAKQILDHLDIKQESLPEYLFTDSEKNFPLTDLDERTLAHYNEDTLFSLKTVRFLKDFSRFRAAPNVETTNRSFVRTAELFRSLGIKNYYFHLQLNNPILKGVDPWDESLTDEIKFMIVNEANNNVWFILRELIKIDGKRFIGNRAVLSFIWCCLCHLNTLIILPRQSGKESWNESLVKIPGGWKKIKDIVVGDIIVAPDSSHVHVNGVYPQGNKPVFKIRLQDGREHVCGAEHLWKIYDDVSDKWMVMNTLEALELYDHRKDKGGKLFVPQIVPEDGEEKQFILSPYSLGKRLGSVKIKPTSPIRKTRQDYYLNSCGLLNKTPEGYYIPKGYLHTPNKNQRLALLQGLLDNIGFVSKGFVTLDVFSEKLAKNIQYLARSLGYIATVTDMVGELSDHDWEYQINIMGGNLADLFTDPEKQSLCYEKAYDIPYINSDKVMIESFQLLSERRECTCIEVDHPEHLYITDDFIVTHNTVGMQAITLILQYIIGRGYKTGLITLASSNRQQFVNAVKKMRSGLPDYLIRMSYKDKDSGNLLTYQGHGVENMNIFEVRVPSGGKDGAENVSRGSSFGGLLGDEPAWTKFIENIVSGSGPATLAEQRNMLEQGMPWFTAQATTPNSTLKDEGRYMYGEFMSSTVWKESFFDAFSISHLFSSVIKNSPKPTTFPKVAIQYNHLQLGYNEDWVIRMMDKLKLPWSKAKIDLLMMWTEEGKNKTLDDKTRTLLGRSKVPHLWNQEMGNTGLFIDWFISKDRLADFISDKSEFFVISCDTSDAKGENNDACTIVIRRAKNGEVVGTGRYSLAFLSDVRDVILTLIKDIPNSVLIIERNRAQDIIDQLLLLLPALDIDPFERIYNEVYQFPVKNSVDFRDVQQTKFIHRKFTKEFYLRYKAKFGFQTNSVSREALYSLIYECVRNTGSTARYTQLIDELISLETSPSGRIDHPNSGNDDVVISWLLGYHFLKSGYNKHLYNIPPNGCLTDIKPLVDKGEKSKYTEEQVKSFGVIREKINELSDKLHACESELIAPRLEDAIRKLSKQLPPELNRLITIDEVIADAKRHRDKRVLENKRKRMRLGYR